MNVLAVLWEKVIREEKANRKGFSEAIILRPRSESWKGIIKANRRNDKANALGRMFRYEINQFS